MKLKDLFEMTYKLNAQKMKALAASVDYSIEEDGTTLTFTPNHHSKKQIFKLIGGNFYRIHGDKEILLRVDNEDEAAKIMMNRTRN